jgi:CheY-like chemotaxis protein
MTTSSGTARSVLIVDDDSNLRRTIHDYADAAGIMAWEATNGLEALWIVKHHRPAVVLLDLTMPRLDGFETARHIQKFDPSIRIFVITGDRREETRRRISALGFEVILKPFELDTLDAALIGPAPPATVRLPGAGS